MGFLDALSDDQLALLGCGVAFFAFGGIMSLSYYVGRAGRTSADSGLKAMQMTGSESVSMTGTDVDSSPRDERKAA